MEGNEFTTKGIKREARALLGDNWSRVLAVMCVALMSLAAVLLVNQLAAALIDAIRASDKDSVAGIPIAGLSVLRQYFSGSYINLIIGGIIFVFYFLLISPLNLGTVKWYTSMVRGEGVQVGQVFDYYRDNSRFISAISFEIKLVFRHLFYGALSALPSIVCFAYAMRSRADGNGSASELMTAAGAALAVVGLIVYVLLMARFFLAKYIFVTGGGYGVGNCFYRSTRYMRGNIGKVLGVMISFVGWIVASILVFPLAATIPYMQTTLADCANKLLEKVE